MNPSRPVVHLELHTGDLAAAHAFYAQLCGWQHATLDTAQGAYLALEMGRGLGGGIVECEAPRPTWLPYVEVEDAARAAARAAQLGARVLLPPREGPSGWRSVVSAGAAGELAFWQPKR